MSGATAEGRQRHGRFGQERTAERFATIRKAVLERGEPSVPEAIESSTGVIGYGLLSAPAVPGAVDVASTTDGACVDGLPSDGSWALADLLDP
jgi:hypothetical protein